MSEVSTEDVMTGAAIDSYIEDESKEELASTPSRSAPSREPNEAEQDDVGEIPVLVDDLPGPPLDVDAIEAGYHFQDIDYFMHKVQRYAQEKGFIVSKDGKFFSWRNPHPVHPDNYRLLQRTTIYCSNKNPESNKKPPPRFTRVCPWKIRILYDRGTLDYMVTDISLEHNHDIGGPRHSYHPHASPTSDEPVIELPSSPRPEHSHAALHPSISQPRDTMVLGRYRLDPSGSVSSHSPTAHPRRPNHSKRPHDHMEPPHPPSHQGMTLPPQLRHYDPTRETAKGQAIPLSTRRIIAPVPTPFVAPHAASSASRAHPPHQYTPPPQYAPPHRAPPNHRGGPSDHRPPPVENEPPRRHGYPVDMGAPHHHHHPPQEMSFQMAQENMAIKRREAEMKWELERQQVQDMELRREMEKQRFFVELQQHERLEKEAAANQRIIEAKADEAEMMLRVNKLKARQELVNAGVPLHEIERVLGVES